MKKPLALTAVALLVTGCTTFETLPSGSESAAKALSFEAPTDAAALYVYRDRRSHFGIHEMILDVNDQEVSLAPSCFKRIELTPGNYHLKANHTDVLGSEQEMDLSLAAGEVRVLEFKPISRFVIPGESKLISRSIDELKQLINSQPLCVQSIARI